MIVVFLVVDVSIDVPETLDLSSFRGMGLQPGEEVLPEVAPPPLMTPDVEVKGILGSHGNEDDDSLYSPLLCQSVCLFSSLMSGLPSVYCIAFGFILAFLPDPFCFPSVFDHLSPHCSFTFVLSHAHTINFVECATVSTYCIGPSF